MVSNDPRKSFKGRRIHCYGVYGFSTSVDSELPDGVHETGFSQALYRTCKKDGKSANSPSREEGLALRRINNKFVRTTNMNPSRLQKFIQIRSGRGEALDDVHVRVRGHIRA